MPDKDIKGKIDWESWVYGPGLAPVKLDFKTKGITDAFNLIDSYINDPKMDHDEAKRLWKDEFVSTTKTIFA